MVTEVYLRNGIHMDYVGERDDIAAVSDGDEDKVKGVEHGNVPLNDRHQKG